jgi:hypothetical protein
MRDKRITKLLCTRWPDSICALAQPPEASRCQVGFGRDGGLVGRYGVLGGGSYLLDVSQDVKYLSDAVRVL